MSAQRPKDDRKKHTATYKAGNVSAPKKIEDDERFKGKSRDARFAPIMRKNMKVQVDARFKGMFTDKRFVMPHTVDKYGRRAKQSTSDDMRRFYHLRNGEEEKEAADEQGEVANEIEADGEDEAVAAAETAEVAIEDQGEVNGAKGKDGESSDESSSEESSSVEEEAPEEVIEDEEDVPTGGETRRLAALKMDWEHLRAVDLLVLFNSFLPSSGSISSVTVYPSQFGLQNMAREAKEGPPREIWKGGDHADQDDKETFSKIRLRRYELNKLKYYFAVIECDTVATASALYAACDGLELERSSNVVDLRFVPDEEIFAQASRDSAVEVPTEYKPPNFATKALQHTNVDLTWDGDDATRQVLKASQWGKTGAGAAEETELQAYLASSSDEYDEDPEARKEKSKEVIEKYRQMLADAMPKAEEEENMEITFMPGLTEKAEEMVQKRLEEKERKNETVWEKHLREKKARKAERKKLSALQPRDDESGEAMFDLGGAKGDDEDEGEDDEGEKKAKRKHKKKEKERRLTHEEAEEQKRQVAELELLVMDKKAKKPRRDDKDDGEREARKKKKKGHKEANTDFKVDLQDDRFKALVESDAFAIDRTNPLFRDTPNTQAIMAAKRKKALEREMQEEKRARDTLKNKYEDADAHKEPKKGADASLAALVASVKRKSNDVTKRKTG